MKINNNCSYVDKHTGSFSLAGEWEFDYSDTELPLKQIKFRYKTEVPSSVYKTMFSAGILPHYYAGTNSHLYRDLRNKVFYYRRKLNVTQEQAEKQAYLCLDGASYYTEILLNGVSTGRHDGMASGPYLNVTELLHEGENEIAVILKSPFYDNEDFDPWNQKGENTLVVSWGNSGDAGCSNGDFCFIGIHSDIRIEFLPKVHISRPYMSTVSIGKDTAKLHLSLELTSRDFDELSVVRGNQNVTDDGPTRAYDNGLTGKRLKKPVYIRIVISDGQGIALKKTLTVFPLDYPNSLIKPTWFDCQYVETDLTLKNPTLWFPANMGEPHLYDVSLELFYEEPECENSECSNPDDSLNFRFGVRTFEAKTPKAQRYTLNHGKYQFAVNGRNFFTRGVNIMPFDMLFDISAERYRKVLTLARDAGIGFIRIWGASGRYETDTFYELCDEIGILVWQDSLLANCPAPKWDLNILRSLVSANVYRIRRHSSLAIYSGGNEINPYDSANCAALGCIMQVTELIDPKRPFFYTSSVGGTAHIYNDMEPTRYRKCYKDLVYVGESGIHSGPTARGLSDLVGDEAADPCDRFSQEYLKNHPAVFNHIMENNPDRIPRMLSRCSQLVNVKSADFLRICFATQLAAYEYYQIMCEAFVENYPTSTGICPWVLTRQYPSVGVQFIDSTDSPCLQYFAVKKAYSNITALLSLCEITYAPGEKVPLEAVVINQQQIKTGRLKLTLSVFSPNLERVFTEEKETELTGYKKRLHFPSFLIPDNYTDTFFFVLITLEGNGVKMQNVYRIKCLSVMKDAAFREKFRSGMEPNFPDPFGNEKTLEDQLSGIRTTLSLKEVPNSRDARPGCRTFCITNTGSVPAYPVVIDTDGKSSFVPDDNVFFIEPGKSVNCSVCLPCDAHSVTVSAFNADDTVVML